MYRGKRAESCSPQRRLTYMTMVMMVVICDDDDRHCHDHDHDHDYVDGDHALTTQHVVTIIIIINNV